MNALELLKQDHENVKQLFREAEEAQDPKRRKELFDQIETELEIHTHIEETVFYPAMEQHEELKDLVAESRDEHEEVKELLEDMESMAPEDEDFESSLQDLIENVEHHAEEEEQEMFPKARQVVGDKALEDLGRQLEAAKGKQQRAAS
jgi:iron-sulfur cluster repair protein YtfE (RIC family)